MIYEDVLKLVDLSKLKRDYLKNPVKIKQKIVNFPPKEDLEYLYLDANLSLKEVACFLGISVNSLGLILKRYEVKKPEYLVAKQAERHFMTKYGYKNPFCDTNKIKQTIINKYGVEHYSQTKQWLEKVKETSLKHYKANFYSQTQKFKNNFKKISEKKIEECFDYDEIYNDYIVKNSSIEEMTVKLSISRPYFFKICEHFKILKSKEAKTKSHMQAIAKSKEKLHGDENFNNREKFKRTNIEKFGVENYTKTKDYLKKSKATKFKKYGDENYVNVEKAKQTCLKKYGVENISQTQKFKNAIKNKQKEIQQKQYLTKKQNNSFNKSKIEDEIFEILSSKFNDIKRQYKSDIYPFSCDFYIPEKDLYIEYQGTWTHGKEAFDSENEEHQKIVNKWKSKQTKFYDNALKVWTISDPLKRKAAKENNLNWIEFFNKEQFIDWFEKFEV